MESVRPTLLSCQETSASLAALIPPNQFWRWKDMWSNSLRTAVFAATLIEYLTNGTLITLPHVAQVLGSKHTLLLIDSMLALSLSFQSKKSGRTDLHYPPKTIYTA